MLQKRPPLPSTNNRLNKLNFTPLLDIKFSVFCRSQWPRGLRRRSAAASLLRLWDRIPPGTWMSVCCEYCVLLGRDLCDELITRPDESYRLWCVVLWARKLVNEESMAQWGAVSPKTNTHNLLFISVINQLNAQFFFHNKFISCLYMFRAHVLNIRRSKLHYTASGIITLKQSNFRPRTCFSVMIPEAV